LIWGYASRVSKSQSLSNEAGLGSARDSTLSSYNGYIPYYDRVLVSTYTEPFRSIL